VSERSLFSFPRPTEQPADDRRDDHRENTELLNAELPDSRFVDSSYLRWLYDLNPLGRAFTSHVDGDDGRRQAHYGLIPTRYRNADRRAPFVFSLNAVSRSGNQRRGFFSELQRRVFTEAQSHGTEMVIGVTNANSTWPVKKMGWRVAGPIPVKLTVPAPRRPDGIESYDITPEFLGSARFDALAQGLDESPAWHWTNCWTPEFLRWRLAAPNGPRYSIHVGPQIFAVSTATRHHGVPVAVVLKLLARDGRFGPLASHGTITEICHHHKAPLAVYAGRNRHVPVSGVRLPERFKPVPLNLVLLSLNPRIDHNTFQLDTYEFLDMDAY
jgi:hypothetical protein